MPCHERRRPLQRGVRQKWCVGIPTPDEELHGNREPGLRGRALKRTRRHQTQDSWKTTSPRKFCRGRRNTREIAFVNLARGPQRRLYCNRPPDADRIQLCWRHLPSCLGLHPWAQADQVSISLRKRSGASSNRVLTTATQRKHVISLQRPTTRSTCCTALGFWCPCPTPLGCQ